MPSWRNMANRKQYKTEWARKRRKTDPIFVEKEKQASRKNRAKNPEKSRVAVRKSYFKRTHEMTPEERQQQIERREHRCDVCGQQKLTKKSLSLDHDRECCSGRKSCEKCRRGFICDTCNLTLGRVKDSEDHLRKLIKYLRYWKGKRVRCS